MGNPGRKIMFFFVVISFILSRFCSASDTITQGGSLKDGESIVSDGDIFELGFFSPGNSTLRYVGIWYHNIQELTVVWVANRERPISGKTGVLTIDSDGNLVILDGNNSGSIWSSNASVSSNNTTAKLNDEGNLVLSGSTEKVYWQSFEQPTDTFLPGMKVEASSRKGENWAFSSWKSPNDPSPGNYSMGVDPRGSPQIVIRKGLERRWRSGHWNKQIFTGVPNMSSNYLYGFKLQEQDGTSYISYVPSNGSDKLRFRIERNGFEEQLRWEEDNNKWRVTQYQPDKTNECELYNKCGKFGVCSSWESPICECMDGFEPVDLVEWRRGNWSKGCKRRTKWKCETNSSSGIEEDGFVVMKSVKMPDFADLVTPGSATSCEDMCLKNCSCAAYAEASGIGCLIWTTNLLDVQHFKKGGNTLNVRVAHSDLGGKSKKSTALIITLTVVGAILLVLPNPSPVSWLRSSEILPSDAGKSKEHSTDLSGSIDVIECSQVNRSELPLFCFDVVATSTNNFSEENKLGEGGFGHVYKGKLPGEQEIAVKRLSRKSGQGLEEFKNEIILIAKLQHRNLVRLLGCCIQGEEKMLLYEYMPNKSLDFFLFDTEKRALLDWRKRFNIIEGIARGLLYLHRDSRLRIIHRDLKASNILLDEEMNPKISDFGMARIFGGNQNELNTNRVVGTFGYMSPEYAMEGLFSVKSDVYSFGVLLLEIVSGRRNTSFRNTEHLSLIGFAWNIWHEGRAMELLDPSIAETCSQNEVLRCIQLGVLCVQDSPLHRPTMSSVILMLESENANLPLPRQPTFTSMRGNIVDMDLFSEGRDHASVSDVTVTMVDGR
ncbi:G-type lectin S-receptor-like serine/threonine-protein kinase [Morus notabilis]|uniref:Receptor-like serine/threonine-protein kinase n=1 Tax=Morus notabilis TaxID=981085 RepID=W9S5M0_9ROSA|nr:G-type lectin S-receptor-like serine/threonine-protein kinase [Morus notabilis]